METSNSPINTEIKRFAIRALIIFILVIAALNLLLPDFSALAYSVKKAAKDEKTRTLLLSFIENPAALYRAAEIDEKNGKLASAAMEMELAIGLLEMHNTSPSVIKRYTTKLDQINAQLKLQSTAPANTSSAHQSTSGTFNGKPLKRWNE